MKLRWLKKKNGKVVLQFCFPDPRYSNPYRRWVAVPIIKEIGSRKDGAMKEKR